MKFCINLLLMLAIACVSYSQIKIDEVRYNNFLSQSKYKDLLDEVNYLINNQVYGKHWKLHYYEALALCGLGADTVANLAFDYINTEFPLKEDQRLFVNSGKQSCSSGPAMVATSAADYLLQIMAGSGQGNIPESVSAGKLGAVFDCTKKNELFEFSAEFDQKEMRNRLFELDQGHEAVNYYIDFLPSGKYNVNSSGRYVIITPKTKDVNQALIDQAAEDLEKIYTFYFNFYNIRPPDKLITVYFMGNKNNLKKVAYDTHGLILPSNNIGYSNLSDLSVLGNSTKQGIGTIKHELFHLMVRTDIGDIPGWLDEGIASLYEESHFEVATLKSNEQSWRTDVLDKAVFQAKPIPSLFELIENNWRSLMPNSTNTICELSINYALAKHFAMFMEEEEVLTKMVEAFKNRKNVFVDLKYKNQGALEIVESVFSEKIEATQERFNKWLDDNYHINIDYSLYSLQSKLEMNFYTFKDLYECDPSYLEVSEKKFGTIMDKIQEADRNGSNADYEAIRSLKLETLNFINDLNSKIFLCLKE